MHRGEPVDHGIGACKTYTPREYPNDRESDLLVFRLENFTGVRKRLLLLLSFFSLILNIAYKNRIRNVIMRAVMVEMSNFKLADSLLGIEVQTSFDDGYQVRLEGHPVLHIPTSTVRICTIVHVQYAYNKKQIPQQILSALGVGPLRVCGRVP